MNNRQVEIQKCRALFPLFAKAVMPSLVLSGFHLKYYRILHRFAKGKIKKLIVTVPPQHGKSLGSTILLVAFLLGVDPNLRIAIASYSTTFAQKFNRSIQRIIDSPIYGEIFPETRLRKGTENYVRNTDEFEIVGHTGSLRAVGRGGPLTGNQVDIMILDDLYKDASEGNSPVVRESVWEWYTSVVKTRQHNDSRELIVFTRWHEDDLIGRLEDKENVTTLKSFDEIDPHYKGYYKLNFNAIQQAEPTELDPRSIGEPLWPERHSLDLLNEKRRLDGHAFNCLYQGDPVSKEGLLYGDNFKTYKELPVTNKKANYTDTADMGEDKLCSVCYQVGKGHEIYITDVVYTNKPMEVTESMTAKMLADNDTRIAYIESNNGGRGFARAVGKLVSGIRVVWFHQSQNKESRILTNSSTVLERIHMPKDWDRRWPEFYNDLTSYKRIYRANRWHDAPDVITGIIEKEPITRTKIMIG